MTFGFCFFASTETLRKRGWRVAGVGCVCVLELGIKMLTLAASFIFCLFGFQEDYKNIMPEVVIMK